MFGGRARSSDASKLSASGSSGAASRFSLLYLASDEYYFESHAALLTSDFISEAGIRRSGRHRRDLQSQELGHLDTEVPIEADLEYLESHKSIEGRLHVASRCLVFEPDHRTLPLIKIPLLQVSSLNLERGLRFPNQEYLSLTTRSYIRLWPRRPYGACKDAVSLLLQLKFTSIETCLSLITSLRSVASLVGQKKHQVLQKVISKYQASIVFDTFSIVDVRENRLQLPSSPSGAPGVLLVSQVLPLQQRPGWLVLTDQRLYFQFFDRLSAEPVLRLPLQSILQIHPRRFMMREIGLEILIDNRRHRHHQAGTISESVYLVFDSPETRNILDVLFRTQPSFQIKPELSHPKMLQRWMNRDIDNFTYLLYLNHLAGRSFQDLSQYPVFPWVITDYTSASLDLKDPAIYRDLRKPVGALNPQRLAILKERFEEMKKMAHIDPNFPPPFLYGTHFSSPGYVLYFLLRKLPEHVLKLHEGRFDKPDRLFLGVAQTWRGCLEDSADVKELIPEFYAIEDPEAGSFLVNELDLDLGLTANGREIDDADLPPWSQGNPKKFVEIMRQALESDYVSENIHHWIDLIFGFKQSGQEAELADNVFYHLTYENAVDIDAEKDPEMRRALQQQVMEFGQMPRSILQHPHPSRNSPDPEDAAQKLFPQPTPAESPSPARRSSSPSHHNRSRSSRASAEDLPFWDRSVNPFVESTRHGTRPASPFSDHATEELKEDSLPSLADIGELLDSAEGAGLGDLELPEIVSLDLDLPPLDVKMEESASPSSKDSPSLAPVELPDLTAFKLKQNFSLPHNGSCKSLALASNHLFSASQSGEICVFDTELQRVSRSQQVSRLALSCLGIPSRQADIGLLGSLDDNIYAYSVRLGQVVSMIPGAHDSSVSVLECVPGAADRFLTGSWDGTVKMWSFRGALEPGPVLELSGHDSGLECLSCLETSAASVAEDGQCLLWDFRMEDSVAELNATDILDRSGISAGVSGNITGMRFSSPHTLLFVSDGGVIWEVDLRRSEDQALWSIRTDAVHQESGPWSYTDLLVFPQQSSALALLPDDLGRISTWLTQSVGPAARQSVLQTGLGQITALACDGGYMAAAHSPKNPNQDGWEEGKCVVSLWQAR